MRYRSRNAVSNTNNKLKTPALAIFQGLSPEPAFCRRIQNSVQLTEGPRPLWRWDWRACRVERRCAPGRRGSRGPSCPPCPARSNPALGTARTPPAGPTAWVSGAYSVGKKRVYGFAVRSFSTVWKKHCVYVCKYRCTHAYTHTYTRINTHTHIHIHICLFVSIHAHVQQLRLILCTHCCQVHLVL